MPFRNGILAGTTLVRERINSPDYVAGSSGWTINKDGSAEFNDLSLRGSITITGDAQSSNYIPGVSGWILRSDGTAEFNGNVDIESGTVVGDIQSSNYVLDVAGWQVRSNGTAQFNGNVDIESAVVTGSIQSENYVANSTGWKLNDDGEAEFNGVFLTGTVDGKVHTGSLVDTTETVVNNQRAVANANPQNTPQIAGHAYQAIVTVSVTGAVVGNRARFRLYNGSVPTTPGTGTQLGTHAPLVKVNTAAVVFESFTMQFVWAAATTTTISNINLAIEFFSGTTSVTARVENTSYAFIINDLGLANRITNL